jgi:TonB-linked SusC/RagA family outer membrane protein
MRKKMKVILLTLTFCCLSAATFAQVISLNLKDVTIKKAIQALKEKTGYSFVYEVNDIDTQRKISIKSTNNSIEEVVRQILVGQYVNFGIQGKSIVITKSTKPLTEIKESTGQQSKKLTGLVTDEKGDPIIGASVVLKGSNTGTITNIEGVFLMDVPEMAQITVSYIGYKQAIVKVGNQNNLKITLEEDTKSLDEIVVVGYGTQRKATLTGAITNISGSDITTTKTSNLAQAIQGKIPGVVIRQQSGQPGSNTTNINVRGFGTPLFVIDDVISSGVDFTRLNSQDVESISVLKDASAAVYGMNADNGVVIVTTKRGKSGKVKVDYSTIYGITSPTALPAMANAAQYTKAWNESSFLRTGTFVYQKEELEKWQTGIEPGYEGSNWEKAGFNDNASQQLHSISLTGGNDVVSFYTGLGYNYDGGILKNDVMNFQKFNFTNNIAVNISKNLKANFNNSSRYSVLNQPASGFDPIYWSTRSNIPINPVMVNGDLNYPGDARLGRNPIALSDRNNGMSKNVQKFMRTNIDLTYSFIKALSGLKVKIAAFYDNTSDVASAYSKTYYLYDLQLTPIKYNTPSTTSMLNNDNNRLSLLGQLTYNKTFFKKHDVGATLVYEGRKYWSSSTRTARQFENFFTSDWISQGSTTNMTAEGSNNQQAFLALIGRFNYAYDGKYLAEFAFRRDESYRYAPGKRTGFFPVASLGWRVSEENFVKKTLPFLTNFKLRGSYGQMGRDLGNPFQFVEGFSLGSAGYYEFIEGTQTSGMSAPAVINPNLTWLTTTTSNIGFDLAIKNGLFSVEFDVYQKDREGLLATRLVSLPNTIGLSMPQENLNSDRARGIEINVGSKGKIGKLGYSFNANANFFRTMITYQERAPFTNSYQKWKNQTAGRWNDVDWIYNVTGQYQNYNEIYNSPVAGNTTGNMYERPGDLIYEDVNGDGKIDGNDTKPNGWDASPNITYGATLALDFDGFDFNMLWQGSGLYSDIPGIGPYGNLFNAGTGNMPAYWTDRWQPIDIYGDIDDINNWIPGKYPAARQDGGGSAIFLGNRQSTFWRKDASFIRLKNIEIGYTLPSKFAKKLSLSKARLFVNGYNLVTFADPFVKQFDPELSMTGTDAATTSTTSGFVYPLSKIFNFGINVSF